LQSGGACRPTVRNQAERLHGFRTTPGDKCPFSSSGPQVARSTGLIALNTRVPVTERWSVQAFGYGTRLSGHTGSGPPHGTSSRSLEPAPCRALLLSQRGLKLQAWLFNSDVNMSDGKGTVRVG
jgi:hypothetical protein